MQKPQPLLDPQPNSSEISVIERARSLHFFCKTQNERSKHTQRVISIPLLMSARIVRCVIVSEEAVLRKIKDVRKQRRLRVHASVALTGTADMTIEVTHMRTRRVAKRLCSCVDGHEVVLDSCLRRAHKLVGAAFPTAFTKERRRRSLAALRSAQSSTRDTPTIEFREATFRAKICRVVVVARRAIISKSRSAFKAWALLRVFCAARKVPQRARVHRSIRMLFEVPGFRDDALRLHFIENRRRKLLFVLNRVCRGRNS